MYRILLFLTSLIVLALACTPTEPLPPHPLHGQWQWGQSIGGIAGWIYTPESTGNQMRLELTSNNYDLFRNDTLINSLYYTIRMMPSPYSQDSMPTIYIENGISQAFEFSENYDTLFLYDNCYDCFAHTYFRIR